MSSNPVPPAVTDPFADVMHRWMEAWQPWADAWSAGTTPATEDPFKAMEIAWHRQLETIATGLEQAMDTTGFAALFARFVEQLLTRQRQWADYVNPQLDSNLRSWNLPSRAQMDRLFELVIGQQERFDEIERNQRELRREVRALGEKLSASAPAPERKAAAKPSSSAASEAA